jgi:hypothetical protein
MCYFVVFLLHVSEHEGHLQGQFSYKGIYL